MSEKKTSLVPASTDTVKRGIEDLLAQVSGGLEEKILNQVKAELQGTLKRFIDEEISAAKKDRKALEVYIKDIDRNVKVIAQEYIDRVLQEKVTSAVRGVWVTFIQGEIEKAFAARQGAFILEIAKQVKQII